MTFDDLIAAAEEIRSRFGGDTSVLLLMPRGYAHQMLVAAHSVGTQHRSV